MGVGGNQIAVEVLVAGSLLRVEVRLEGALFHLLLLQLVPLLLHLQLLLLLLRPAHLVQQLRRLFLLTSLRLHLQVLLLLFLPFNSESLGVFGHFGFEREGRSG